MLPQAALAPVVAWDQLKPPCAIRPVPALAIGIHWLLLEPVGHGLILTPVWHIPAVAQGHLPLEELPYKVRDP